MENLLLYVIRYFPRLTEENQKAILARIILALEEQEAGMPA